ncbi:hypothetical protein AYO22_05137 [Fonsecaea multimorphosa]|nr:hypothetical protein AYO22_05137 [Fonsecaea multimorphosa]
MASHDSTSTASSETAIVDEEKDDSTHDNVRSDSEDEDENQKILNAAWGKHGRYEAIIQHRSHVDDLTRFASELDYTTIYNYQNYAASDFGEIALPGALMTVGTIVSRRAQAASGQDLRRDGPCRDVRRGRCLPRRVLHHLCVAARGFGQYTGGYIVYSIGQTGVQILNQVIVADITSSCRFLIPEQERAIVIIKTTFSVVSDQTDRMIRTGGVCVWTLI